MKKYKLLNTKTILFAVGLSFLTACSENDEIELLKGEPISIEESEEVNTSEEVIDEVSTEETIETEKSLEESIEVEIPRSPIQKEEDKFEAVDNKYQYVYFNKSADIYDDINGNTIANIEVYNKAYEIFAVDNWSLIEIDETLYYVENDYIDSLDSTFVEVDIGNQNVKLYVDNELIVDTDTVSGGKGHPTHVGIFKIWSMEHDRYLTGPGYKCWVSYFMPFDGGIGLHDATWRDKFGGEIYKKNGSHGCVNLPREEAETIYENVGVGTKVLVHN